MFRQIGGQVPLTWLLHQLAQLLVRPFYGKPAGH
jgi:hypothetical protein